MPLAIDYDPDPQVDVLRITTEQRAWVGWHQEAESDLVVKIGENHNRDVVGLLIIGASGFVAPYFRVKDADGPVKTRLGDFTRYDPETDTLTWGVVHDAADRITQADPVVVYWGFPEPEDGDEWPPPVLGVALLNAAKNLAPWFVLAEPAAG